MTRAQRDARIRRARQYGWTYQRIADHYNVSRQRAWQIVTKGGEGVTRERVTCPVCGKIVGGYVPRGGNGTGLRPRWHKRDDTRRPCVGRLYILVVGEQQ